MTQQETASLEETTQSSSESSAILVKSMPTVTVCTVTQNRSHLLPLLEACILNQTYPLELIDWVIVDDSDPGRPRFSPTPETTLKIKFVSVDQKIPLGQKRNLSHRFCKGDIIVYMDDDEYYPPLRIEHAVDQLEKSGKEMAGATNLPILFIPECELWMSGPFGDNHATANTFAFKRSLLEQARYEDQATHAEEKSFLKNYTIPMVQLDPKRTIVCFGHQANTFDKRKLKMGGKNPRMRLVSLPSIDEWIDSSILQQHIAAHRLIQANEKSASLITINRLRNADLEVKLPAVGVQSIHRLYATATDKRRLDVIIPSRSQDKQKFFLQTSIASIESQTTCGDLQIRVVVCCDPGFCEGNLPRSFLDIVTVSSAIPSQAAALNVGIETVESHYVAFLEDDDQWHPQFLEVTMKAQSLIRDEHGRGGLVSSTQQQINANGNPIGVNDYAIPSGWLMDRETLVDVGKFDCSYRFHLDNDWLGRAAQKSVPRLHLFESHPPLCGSDQLRDGLQKVLRNSANTCQLIRHHCQVPLIKRLVHDESGMGRIRRDKISGFISHQENLRLLITYGRIPW